jgi:hypothetical protein
MSVREGGESRGHQAMMKMKNHREARVACPGHCGHSAFALPSECVIFATLHTLCPLSILSIQALFCNTIELTENLNFSLHIRTRAVVAMMMLSSRQRNDADQVVSTTICAGKVSV